MTKYLFSIIIYCTGIINIQASNLADKINEYNIKWDSPSKDASSSMPIGGGDIGANVWVESGDLLFYMQRSGCFSETGEYLKLGRIRLRMTPNPFDQYKIFKQELILKDGYIEFYAIGKNKNNSFPVKIIMWIDIFTHSIHLAIDSEKVISLTVSYENWRTKDKKLLNENKGRFGCFSMEGYPGDIIKQKDIVNYIQNDILFYHRNPEAPISHTLTLQQQGLEKYKDSITNDISYRTFGGIISGENLIKDKYQKGKYCETTFKSWNLKSKNPSRHHHLTITTHVAQTNTLDLWKTKLLENQKFVKKTMGNYKKNREWWNQFWERSWIITSPNKKDEKSPLWQAGRNYQLMRFQLGCNLYGDYPSKFNGGNFTFDPVLTDTTLTHDPDWRAWGGNVFTAQNQRLLYWPMLKSGDFDGMKSQFNLYEQGLQGAMLKVKEHFGHQGAIFCEYASTSGLDFGAGWGWNNSSGRKRGKEVPFGDKNINGTNGYNELVEKGVMASPYVSYHWESQIEYAYMILEYNRFTGNNIDQYIPFIKNSLLFFDQHYQKRESLRNGNTLDNNGKLVIFPSTSCESYRGAKNPTDLIAGIRSCLETLISLNSECLTQYDKEYFQSYLNRLPNINFSIEKGDTIVKPAESYLIYQNVECPQFYPLFPFNRYSLQDHEMQFFKNTWKHGTFPKDMYISWHQDGIFYARMGMTQNALKYNMKKLEDSQRRFPTFWGPGHDWVPDLNWGGSGMIGLQEMLMQSIDEKIYILPVWPSDMDVCFKLHAPDNTTVELDYIDGNIQKLIVFPETRKKDIIFCIKTNTK